SAHECRRAIYRHLCPHAPGLAHHLPTRGAVGHLRLRLRARAPMTDYDPFMATVVEGDPNPLYAELRAKTPRLFIERYNAWFFSTFEDVWNLEKEHRLSVEGGITPSQLLLGAPANPLMVSQMEPPVHTPFRTAFNELV